MADPAISGAQSEWLRYAPKPAPLPPGKQWHVFLSYRSVNRPWVIGLYDALTQAGFTAFLDQFALVPGDSLVRSLEEGLEQSATGVIVWSTENRDSAWVRQEYESMVALQSRRGSGFRFVVAKLDADELPLFASKSLHQDFSDSPEGPRGTGMIRLMFGLVGTPPTDEAVRLALRVDQETKEAVQSIAAAQLIGDWSRLVELMASQDLAWRSAPLLPCVAAQALIDLKRNDEAVQALEPVEAAFPRSVRPKQLRALALARRGDWLAAHRVLAQLYAGGHRDAETLGLFARTWMDRYKDSKERRHLETSRDLYAEAFRIFPDNTYTGINAASKSVFLGEESKGAELARQVEAVISGRGGPADYWEAATLAEGQLIQRNYDEAARLYKAAIGWAPEARGSHGSTLGQAKLLMEHLETPAESRAAIEAALA